MDKQELSNNPVRIEIDFDPVEYIIDPKKCIHYKFIFEGSTEVESMHVVDIKILETLYQCTSNVGKVINKYIRAYNAYEEEVKEEIHGLTDDLTDD